MPPSLYSIHHINHYYITEGAYNQHQSIYLKQGGEREVGGGIGMGNTCKPMAVSFQCMTKFTTNK